ncbi:hydrolase 1, exosortase A system-associated [Aliiglaciecola sp. CAU 1673]|uniref:hydrolase 1, exosortase A system-associated n=1 Tax=Aliiglaciecola sp. CAU 1673 TaxID=3032595 RepID=UPI0023DC7862|nr:hydrolase 1, exosortase A system-associated [Aliiglaciecola sp. CAU 1673]MDF2177309.1 hydrolase 1, exosortase A system-associated [Aliiglaciecola sp. CAU 1673]
MEKALVFECEGQELIGILHQPEQPQSIGVLLVVGGPQYRVGSHRQFVLLSRYLASQGIASMRFDYRGMGDSAGDKQVFDAICADIKSACDHFCLHTGLEKVVIWGLCDAASAAMIYAHKDDRIAGLVLLNPWLRSEQSRGKTMVKHYYLKRLMSKDFWMKFLKGKVSVGSSLKDAKGFVRDSMGEAAIDKGAYQERMRAGLHKFDAPVCLILSGQDLTAREFEEQAMQGKAWKLAERTGFELHRLLGADHTFSAAQFKQQVEQISAQFVSSLSRAG